MAEMWDCMDVTVFYVRRAFLPRLGGRRMARQIVRPAQTPNGLDPQPVVTLSKGQRTKALAQQIGVQGLPWLYKLF